MITRTEYLNQLNSFRDKQLIKVITGIRRCGKSTLLDLFREELLKSGVNHEQIIAVNFEDAEVKLHPHAPHGAQAKARLRPVLRMKTSR